MYTKYNVYKIIYGHELIIAIIMWFQMKTKERNLIFSHESVYWYIRYRMVN